MLISSHEKKEYICAQKCTLPLCSPYFALYIMFRKMR